MKFRKLSDFRGARQCYLYGVCRATLAQDGTGLSKGIISYQYTVPNAGWGAATVVDLNEDGHPDIAFANGPRVLFGKGDGTYTPGGIAGEEGCHFADIDKDGHVDAFCARVDETSNASSYFLDVLNGKGNGSFDSTPIYSVSYPYKDFIQPVGTRDLNGDGYTDIIGLSQDSLVVFFGSSGIQFSTPVHYSFYPQIQDSFAGDAQDAALIADFDQDGHADLATSAINGIDITYGRADGTFDAPPITQSGAILNSAVVSDFNEDGTPDVLTSGSPPLQLNLGKGDGSFASSEPVQTPTPPLAATGPLFAGDFDGDGHKDVLVSGQTAASPLLFLGHGDGTFADPIRTNFALPPNYDQLAVPVDLNGDGRDDVVGAQGYPTPASLNVSLSNGDGTFTAVTTALPDGSYGTAPAAADFNKDGHPDLVVPAPTSLLILLGHGDGTFDVQPAALALPGKFQAPTSGVVNVSAVATGDFDHDGNPDIAALVTTDIGDSPNLVFVYYGDGHGGFTVPITAVALDFTYSALQSADLNGDGFADLILAGNAYAGAGPSGIAVVKARLGRTFSAETDLIAGASLTSLAIADFNRDGQPDIFVANNGFNANSFVVLQNQGDTSTTLTSSANPSIVGESITFTATIRVPPSLTKIPSAPSTVGLAGLSGDPVTLPVTFASVEGAIVGTARYQTSSFAAGSYILIASFSGNNEVNPSTSAPLIQVVNPAPSYTITASPATLQFVAGATSGNTSTVSVNSFNGFTGNVSLACSVAPVVGGTVSNPPTCSFGASTLVVTSAGECRRLHAPMPRLIVPVLGRVVYPLLDARVRIWKPRARSRWVRKSHPWLNGRTPLSLLKTDAGSRFVEELLMQITKARSSK